GMASISNSFIENVPIEIDATDTVPWSFLHASSSCVSPQLTASHSVSKKAIDL
ncbi:hypothetical protein CRM22_001442, partial [Opisthorchis felineus]